MKVNGEDVHATPDPPLNLHIKSDGKPISFKLQINKLATLRNVKQVEKYINDKANERNQLLYAADKGCPHLESIDSGFSLSKRR